RCVPPAPGPRPPALGLGPRPPPRARAPGPPHPCPSIATLRPAHPPPPWLRTILKLQPRMDKLVRRVAARIRRSRTRVTTTVDADSMMLPDVPLRQTVELVSIDLPADEVEPLLERGILPGCRMCPVRHSPSG